MAMIYFYFHTYFVIERLMHGDHHLGIGDDEVVERFIDLLSHGLWTERAPAATKKTHAASRRPDRSSHNGTR